MSSNCKEYLNKSKKEHFLTREAVLQLARTISTTISSKFEVVSPRHSHLLDKFEPSQDPIHHWWHRCHFR